MSAVDDILEQLPVNDIAAQLGVTPEQAEAATRQALPALLGGMAANAEDPGGADSIAEALEQHPPLRGTVDLSGVDTDDGHRIVRHVFGDSRDEVADRLAGTSQAAGLSGDLMKRLLAILAPVVLSYLAGRLTSRSGSGERGGGLVVTVLEEVLKGTTSGSTGSAGGVGGILGDVLGGLLGGGRR